jgi:TRAP-type uncharacterized transport system fused permease subunit
MEGDPLHIGVDLVTALIGIWLMSFGIVGYSMRPINWLERAIYVVVGALLLAPIALFPQAIYFNVVAAILGAALVGREYLLRSRLRMRATRPGIETSGS